jgi:hypothetical protein
MKLPRLNPTALMSRFALLLTAFFCCAVLPVRAVVDDSHSAAMEAAVPAVKAGFKIRQEYWNGTLKSGEQKIVKQQLFKGNEYWFFLGTDSDDVTLKVDIYDRKGTKINVETKLSSNAAAVRVLAPATGTYIVTFSLTTKDGESIPWALAYGYR